MKIEFRNISKSYGSSTVIQGVSFTIQSNELFFLLGPSGCGKTTLLRILAGFIHPDNGEIFLGDRFLNSLPPEQRQIPMVFQSYALWPHLNVFENVAYGLRLQKLTNQEIKKRTFEALEVTRMADYSTRSITQLSGGQQQRIAISRALALNPKVLLLDEPLSNLDAKLRMEMREELLEIHRRHPFTGVYVTHDQEEALTMATRIALLNQGKILQMGSPQEIFTKPQSHFVAEFMGSVNWFKARVINIENGSITLETDIGIFSLNISNQSFVKDQDILLGFRPSTARLNSSTPKNSLVIQCSILQYQYVGAFQKLTLQPIKLPKNKIQVLELNPHLQYKIGDLATIDITPDDLILIPTNGKN